MSATTQAMRQLRRPKCRPRDVANDNQPGRRVVVQLSSTVPISIVETEVFDILIGPAADFAANDNEKPNPKPDVIRGPPATEFTDQTHIKRKEAI